MLEFGFNASFRYNTTTDPQVNFFYVKQCVVKTVVAAAPLLQLICLWFPPVRVWLLWVHHSIPSASHALFLFPCPCSLHQSHCKKKKKEVILLPSRGFSLYQSASRSVSLVFGLPRCSAKAFLELNGTFPPCCNDRTHWFSNNSELDLKTKAITDNLSGHFVS